jgi:hypothetical protein
MQFYILPSTNLPSLRSLLDFGDNAITLLLTIGDVYHRDIINIDRSSPRGLDTFVVISSRSYYQKGIITSERAFTQFVDLYGHHTHIK